MKKPAPVTLPKSPPFGLSEAAGAGANSEPVCSHCGLTAPSATAVGLTGNQRELLLFLEEQTARGMSPSFAEMMTAIDARSKNSVSRLLTRLEERGYVRRALKRRRSVVVIGSVPAEANA